VVYFLFLFAIFVTYHFFILALSYTNKLFQFKTGAKVFGVLIYRLRLAVARPIAPSNFFLENNVLSQIESVTQWLSNLLIIVPLINIPDI
jgi:hypothetical protein